MCGAHSIAPSFKFDNQDWRYCSAHKAPHPISAFDGDALNCRIENQNQRQRVGKRKEIMKAGKAKPCCADACGKPGTKVRDSRCAA